MALAACCYQIVHKGTNLAQSKWKTIRHDREVRPFALYQRTAFALLEISAADEGLSPCGTPKVALESRRTQ